MLFVCLLLASIASAASVQEPTHELAPGYYMVVAAYSPSAVNYAKKYVSFLNDKGVGADMGFSVAKNLIIVYSKNYSTKPEAVAALVSERERTSEPKAWVYSYHPEGAPAVANNTEDDTKKEPVENSPVDTPNEDGMIKKDSVKIEKVVAQPVTEDTAKAEVPISHQGMTYLNIDAFDARSGKPIEIEFKVIDLAHNRQMATATSGSSFPLKEPNSASKLIQVQSNDVGWQKQSFDFKYYEPVIDPMSIFLDNLGDTTFVSFEMTPIRKGDIVTLYQVFFYKDAAIMMEKSKYELDQVVSLLQNNPTIKIKIHGHTNGKSAGKIIALKDSDDVDFFNINGDHRELEGTAVRLSEERAKIVGRYLQSKGISPDRFEAKGWGGKKMLYDKHSPKAKYNVRVEIEVIED